MYTCIIVHVMYVCMGTVREGRESIYLFIVSYMYTVNRKIFNVCSFQAMWDKISTAMSMMYWNVTVSMNLQFSPVGKSF